MRRLVEEDSKIFPLRQKHCNEGCDPESHHDEFGYDAQKVDEMAADGSLGSDVLL